MKTYAEMLVKNGLSVIPIRPDGSKGPAVSSWKQYQDRCPTTSELVDWFCNERNNGVAIICGKVSGNLEVIDFDDPSAIAPWIDEVTARGGEPILEKTVIVQTPSEGLHVYYRCSLIHGNQKLAEQRDENGKSETLIETRGEGGYVIAPGSPAACHPLKRPYELLSGQFETMPVITLDERQILLDAARKFNKIVKPKKIVVGPSAKNGTHDKPGDDFNNKTTWDEILAPAGWELIYEKNSVGHWRRPGKEEGISATTNYDGNDLFHVFSSNADPFESDTSYSKFAAYAYLNHNSNFSSAAKQLANDGYGIKIDKSNEAITQKALLLEAAKDLELWHDQEREAYATVSEEEQSFHCKLKSKTFKDWLSHRAYKNHGCAPSNQSIDDVLRVLEGKAKFDGHEYETRVRIAGNASTSYIDLADGKGTLIRVDASGAADTTDARIKLISKPGMRPLPFPSLPKDIEQAKILLGDLRKFCNLKNDDDWLLFLVAMLSAYRPFGPFVVTLVVGEQGSAKSTLCKILRRLVDPSTTPLRTAPREERDLWIAANNGWLIAFDNVSSVSGNLSDSICRLATGGGNSYRSHYENESETLFQAQRMVLLNTIDDLYLRGDLLDRSIRLNCEKIADGERLCEEEFWKAFDEKESEFLGALFLILSKTLKHLPHIKLDRSPRMADYAKFGVAVETALGLHKDTFLNAYSANREGITAMALENRLAPLILSLPLPINETPTQLWKRLNEIVGGPNDSLPRWFPSNSQRLSSELRRLAPSLRQQGVEVEIGKSGKRFISLSKVANDDEENVGWVASVVSVAKRVISVMITRSCTLR